MRQDGCPGLLYRREGAHYWPDRRVLVAITGQGIPASLNMMTVALGISALFAESGLEAVLVPCLLLWALLYTLGALNEGRPYALRLELARLLVVVPAGVLGIALAGDVALPPAWLWSAAGLYVAASLAGLYVASGSHANNHIKQSLMINK